MLSEYKYRLYSNEINDVYILNNVKILCCSTRSLPPVIEFGSTHQQHQPMQQLPTYGRSVHHDHRHTYGASDHNDLNCQNGPEKSQYHELNTSQNIGK